MRFIKLDKRSDFSIHDPIGIGLVAILFVDISQLNEFKF